MSSHVQSITGMIWPFVRTNVYMWFLKELFYRLINQLGIRHNRKLTRSNVISCIDPVHQDFWKIFAIPSMPPIRNKLFGENHL